MTRTWFARVTFEGKTGVIAFTSKAERDLFLDSGLFVDMKREAITRREVVKEYSRNYRIENMAVYDPKNAVTVLDTWNILNIIRYRFL